MEDARDVDGHVAFYVEDDMGEAMEALRSQTRNVELMGPAGRPGDWFGRNMGKGDFERVNEVECGLLAAFDEIVVDGFIHVQNGPRPEGDLPGAHLVARRLTSSRKRSNQAASTGTAGPEASPSSNRPFSF